MLITLNYKYSTSTCILIENRFLQIKKNIFMIKEYVCMLLITYMVTVMAFHATFNNISVISCRSGLSVEETGIPGENYRPVASH